MNKVISSIVLFFCVCYFTQLHAQPSDKKNKEQSAIDSIIPVIEKELTKAKMDLDLNSSFKSSDNSDLKDKLDEIWYDLKARGYSERTGSEGNWRGAFVSMQAIIEKSIAITLKEKRITSAEGFIVAPRMPTPLMINKGTSFKTMDLNDPICFAQLRRMILEEYLNSGARLNAVYSFDAAKLLADQKSGLDVFNNVLKNFANNLKDLPLIKTSMNYFPLEKTGAIYYLNGNIEQAITIQSYQVGQINKSVKTENLWAIRFGNQARNRIQEMNGFFEINDASQLVRR